MTRQQEDEAVAMNEVLGEVELRELSRTLGTLIPKKEACLDEAAFRYCLLPRA